MNNDQDQCPTLKSLIHIHPVIIFHPNNETSQLPKQLLRFTYSTTSQQNKIAVFKNGHLVANAFLSTDEQENLHICLLVASLSL